MTNQARSLFLDEPLALELVALHMHMFFNPEPAEAQQMENSGGIPLLQSGFDAEELGGDFYVGVAMPLLKTTAEGELHEELLLVSEVQQHHFHKVVCGFQNAGQTSSAQDRLFQPRVTAANLGVLLVQSAQIKCVRPKHSRRSTHRPSSRVAVQFSFLFPPAGEKKDGITARFRKCLKTLRVSGFTR